MPAAQEVSSKTCNVGFPVEELKVELANLLDGLPKSLTEKIDYSCVTEGWNSKVL